MQPVAAIDSYLASAPLPHPEPETVAAMSAWFVGEPPLPERRLLRELRRDDLVEELISSLELDPEKRGKVKRYVSELEVGALDPISQGQSDAPPDEVDRLLTASA